MRCGIALLGNRVAPRCTCADGMLVATLSRGGITSHRCVSFGATTYIDLIAFLKSRQIDTLVCGGIGRETKEALAAHDVTAIDNVACPAEEALRALENGTLRSGYGFTTSSERRASGPLLDFRAGEASGSSRSYTRARDSHSAMLRQGLDCIRCEDRVCLRGENCFPKVIDPEERLSPDLQRVLEAATDVSREDERKLCRLSELVYFCLEMEFRRIGIAFCIDLLEPAQILTRVLGRFFDVLPVCCKVGGIPRLEYLPPVTGEANPTTELSVACNPMGQARILNRFGAHLNIIVGLCIGSDCAFTRESNAPVTTLFVKDKSLANNPIGAVYSEYYLRESVTPVPAVSLAENGTVPRKTRAPEREERS